MRDLLDQLADMHGVAADELAASSAVWADICHTVFTLKEFIFVG